MKLNTSKIMFNASDLNRNIKLPKEITSDLAEETGLHIGDGRMNFYKNRGLYQLRGHFNDDKEHYNTRINELYKKLYNFKPSMRDMESTGVYGFQIWSNAIAHFKNNILIKASV